MSSLHADSISGLKARLRGVMREHLLAMPIEDYRARSRDLRRHLEAMPIFLRARTILAFWPILPVDMVAEGEGGAGGVPSRRRQSPEPDIRHALERAIARGQRVCLPAFDWADGHKAMEPVRVIDVNTDLVPDRHGLWSPRPGGRGPVPIGEVDVVLVPGLAFNRQGCRLGRGGGFFDRFLARPGLRAQTIGVCFESQVRADIPVEPHDVRVQRIVTDARDVVAATTPQ